MNLVKSNWGLKWRSNTSFILFTVAIGLFTDLFLYGLIVPILPFMLRDRVHVPQEKVQAYTSGLLAAYAGASVLFSIPAGWIADKTGARQTPFLAGLAALLAATVLLAVGQSIAVLVVARVLQGISAAVVWTVGLAMVLDTVGSENLGKVIGSIFSFISVGELLAPVLGGVLYDRTGYGGVFGIGSAILGIDFIMRALVVEKKVARRYEKSTEDSNPHGSRDLSEPNESDEEEVSEQTGLLPKKRKQLEDYKIPIESQPRIIRAVPILYCLHNPRLLTALLLAFIQASLLATFDATIPTQAEELFNFSSLNSGLLFIALDIPYLLLGPVAGWAVDKYGTKIPAVCGFGYLVPVLILLRLPDESVVRDKSGNVTLYSGLLSLCGVGMAVIGSPAIVEGTAVIQDYDTANPDVFGEGGGYAQLYSFNSLVFSLGLTVGPIVSGALRDSIGYGNMNMCFAGIVGATSILAFVFVGGRIRKGPKRS